MLQLTFLILLMSGSTDRPCQLLRAHIGTLQISYQQLNSCLSTDRTVSVAHWAAGGVRCWSATAWQGSRDRKGGELALPLLFQPGISACKQRRKQAVWTRQLRSERPLVCRYLCARTIMQGLLARDHVSRDAPSPDVWCVSSFRTPFKLCQPTSPMTGTPPCSVSSSQ